MKTWLTIFFLIFVTWFLDQMGWLKPLLVFTGWGLVLLVLLISLIARPRFFFILKESILNMIKIEKHKKKMQELEQEYQSVTHAADENKIDQLLQFAKEHDIGDAWFKLATILATCNLPEDQTLATEYFQKAVNAKRWLQPNQEVCILEWEKRLFFGMGCKPEYQKLMANWEQTHFPGFQRESELAWLYANAKDFEKAWYWLMLGKARWSDSRPAILPKDLYAVLYTDLEKRLSKKSRLILESSANDQAYQEFVSSR